MKRAIKILSILATVCAMVWAASPALASCAFSLAMLQNGAAGQPPGLLLSGATHVNGFFWELGFGDPADGAGNDGSSLITGYPAFTQAAPGLQWIKGAPGSARVDYDWFNSGIDNCISGGSGAILSTVLVYYMIDSNEDYAIAALQGIPTPVPHSDLDVLVTGLGANGNDVPFVARNVAPQVANVTITDDFCLAADVLPAMAGVNIWYDAGGPYAGVVDVNGLALDNGGTLEACDPNTGCTLPCVNRNANLCWGGGATAVASSTPGSSICLAGPLIGTPCDPGDPGNFCDLLGGPGSCPPAADVVVPFGPPIPGGCVFIGGPTIDDDVVDFRVLKNGKHTRISWKATQFAVSSFNIIDAKRGRTINHDPISRIGSNDGNTYSYEFVATGADLRGAKDLTLEMVRTDGQTITFNVVD